MFTRFDTIPRCDGRTDTIAATKTDSAYSIAARCNNVQCVVWYVYQLSGLLCLRTCLNTVKRVTGALQQLLSYSHYIDQYARRRQFNQYVHPAGSTGHRVPVAPYARYYYRIVSSDVERAGRRGHLALCRDDRLGRSQVYSSRFYECAVFNVRSKVE